MTKARQFVLLLLMAVLTVGAAGCGGEDDELRPVSVSLAWTTNETILDAKLEISGYVDDNCDIMASVVIGGDTHSLTTVTNSKAFTFLLPTSQAGEAKGVISVVRNGEIVAELHFSYTVVAESAPSSMDACFGDDFDDDGWAEAYSDADGDFGDQFQDDGWTESYSETDGDFGDQFQDDGEIQHSSGSPVSSSADSGFGDTYYYDGNI